MGRQWRLDRDETSGNQNERWLVTYADMVTLLWIFFIVMYALSSRISAGNWEKLSKSLKSSLTTKKDVFKSSGGGEGDFTQMQQKVKQSIAQFDGKSAVKVDLSDRGMVISLLDTSFFSAGEVNLNPSSYAVLKKIGDQLAPLPNAISIEGHTDNIPYVGKYGNNWTLSATRANNLLMFFVKNCKVAPRRFQLVSYAEYRPLFPNDTPEHRAMNRRVDIVVSEAPPQVARTPKPSPSPTTPSDQLMPPPVPGGSENGNGFGSSGNSSSGGSNGFDNPFGH